MVGIENYFAIQAEYNKRNADQVGLSVSEYVSLNTNRLKRSNVLEDLLQEISQNKGCVPEDKIQELGRVLQEMISFAINNRLFDDATVVQKLLILFARITNQNN